MRTTKGWVLGLVLLGGCGDWTGSTGNEGRLYYGLYTEYEVPEADLRSAKIVTGHEQRIGVSLTEKGFREIDEPGHVLHSISPSAGVDLVNVGGGEATVPDFDVLVSTPGTYRIDSRADGEMVDWIELQFARPEGFDLLSMVRAPWDEDFRSVTGDPIAVEEGSQVTFQAVPLGGDGGRLAGDMTTSLGVEPDWAVVPGVGVIESWEDGIWTVGGEVNFYFIDPGTVTFTVTDPVSLATGEAVFEVTPIARD